MDVEGPYWFSFITHDVSGVVCRHSILYKFQHGLEKWKEDQMINY